MASHSTAELRSLPAELASPVCKIVVQLHTVKNVCIRSEYNREDNDLDDLASSWKSSLQILSILANTWANMCTVAVDAVYTTIPGKDWYQSLPFSERQLLRAASTCYSRSRHWCNMQQMEIRKVAPIPLSSLYWTFART